MTRARTTSIADNDKPVVSSMIEPARRRRWLRHAGRAVVWLVLVWILVRGVSDIFAPPAIIASSSRRAAPSQTADPSVDAFAAAFAREYWTFTPGQQDSHVARVGAYLAPAVAPGAGLVLPDAGPAQQAELGIVTGRERVDDQRTLVAVAVVLRGRGSGLRYLTVPVLRDKGGGLVVYDLPALAPAPRLATLPDARKVDEEGEPVAARDQADVAETVERYFTAYLAGDAEQLALVMPVNAQPAVPPGRQELVGIDEITQLERSGSRLVCRVRLRAAGMGGATLALSYRVELRRSDRWQVQSINSLEGSTP